MSWYAGWTYIVTTNWRVDGTSYRYWNQRSKAGHSSKRILDTGQQEFLDLRVFDPNTCRYSNSSLSQCYTTNEKDITIYSYNQRIMQVRQGTFSPLDFFSSYGVMGRECQVFYSRLCELLPEKSSIHKSVMTHWVRSKLCYALLKSCLLCLRGSPLRNRHITEVEQDIAAQHELCSIR